MKTTTLLGVRFITATLIMGFVLGLTLLVPMGKAQANSSTPTVDELRTMIQNLQAQISLLKEQLAQSEVEETPRSTQACVGWSRALSRGSRGDDVNALQSFLKSKGYFDDEVTDYFGVVTENAVKRFQAAHGVVSSGDAYTTGYGMVGRLTRAKLNALCTNSEVGSSLPIDESALGASPRTGEVPLTVNFWSEWSGQTGKAIIKFGDGESEEVDYCYAPSDYCLKPGKNTHTYTEPGNYGAKLMRESDNVVIGSVRIEVTEEDSRSEYDLGDVDSVTYMDVDPIKEAADDEYRQYTIKLNNNEVRTVKTFGLMTSEMYENAFRESGYTGDVSELVALAVEVNVPKYDPDPPRVDLKVKGKDRIDKIAANRRVSISWETESVEDCKLIRKHRGKTITSDARKNKSEKNIILVRGADVYGLDNLILSCKSTIDGSTIRDNVQIDFYTAQKTYKAFVNGELFVKEERNREKALGQCLKLINDKPKKNVTCTFGGDELFSTADKAAEGSDPEVDPQPVSASGTAESSVLGASTSSVIESLKSIVADLETVAQLLKTAR